MARFVFSASGRIACFFCLLSSPCLCVCVSGSAGPPSYPDKKDLLVLRDGAGKERPVRTAADWGRRRQHILAAMQQVMGTLPGDDARVPLDVKVTAEVATPRYVRKKLTFAVEKGD